MGVLGKILGSVLIILGLALTYAYLTNSPFIPSAWLEKPISTLVAVLILIIPGIILFRTKSKYANWNQ